MLEGVLCAIVTPFTENGETINESALRDLVERNIADGVDGFVPAGGTGEFATLSHQERKRLLEIVTDQVKGRVSVLAHTGATSTREAIELSRHARDVGADALMLATPYYEPINFDIAFDYYAAVADAVDLPICAYNFPPATGLHLDVPFLLRIAREISQVRYIKDSSSDLNQMNTLLSEHRDDIAVLNGEDALLLPACLMGAPGMVMGSANFMAPGLARLHAAARSGDVSSVVAIWRQLNPLLRAVSAASYNSGVKAACEILGLKVGTVRAPIPPLTGEQHSRLKAALDAADPALLTGAHA